MEEVFNKGNMKVVDELISPSIIEHSPLPGQEPGLEGLKKSLAAWRQAFPDLCVTVDDLIADGDKVVIRTTRTGTHKGTFVNIAATGKQIRVEGIDILQFSGGKVVEH